MKVKVKKVVTYEHNPLSKYQMMPKGEIYINPYLVTINHIKRYSTIMGMKEDFVLLNQRDKACYVLLEDIADIIEIC